MLYKHLFPQHLHMHKVVAVLGVSRSGLWGCSPASSLPASPPSKPLGELLP